MVTAALPSPLSETGFQSVPSLLLNDLARNDTTGRPVLEHVDIAVYALLKAHTGAKDHCWPSLERLASLARCSNSTIQRSLKRLDVANHIQRKGRTRKGTGIIYILTDLTASGVVRRERKIPAPRKALNLPPRVSGEPEILAPLNTGDVQNKPILDELAF
jgi:hypothetical protein